MDHSLIEKTRRFVQDRFAGEGSGHDWWHLHRVWNLARVLADREGAERTVTEIAALLHDVADWKLAGDGEAAGLLEIRHLLTGDLPADALNHVCDIVAGVSFKGAEVPTPMPTLEGRVVQDADRLDAMGAIGIARAFTYGGAKSRLIHDPGHPPERHQSFEAYKKNRGPSINHFHEKLLLLKDRMHTATGRRLAEQRHLFMETYLDQFHREWDGEC